MHQNKIMIITHAMHARISLDSNEEPFEEEIKGAILSI